MTTPAEPPDYEPPDMPDEDYASLCVAYLPDAEPPF